MWIVIFVLIVVSAFAWWSLAREIIDGNRQHNDTMARVADMEARLADDPIMAERVPLTPVLFGPQHGSVPDVPDCDVPPRIVCPRHGVGDESAPKRTCGTSHGSR